MTGSGTMTLPFDSDQFFAVFARYNEAVWPVQVVLTGLAIVAALLVWRASRAGDRVISGILAGLWAWMGVVYHFTFFRSINPAAVAFAAAFLVEAAAFVVIGVVRGRLQFRVSTGVSGLAAGVIVVYALAVYPLLGQAGGHVYPAAPTFGLPCPTAIFTLGLLIAAVPHVPKALLLVPLAWAALGTVAALQLGVPEDLGLPAAALVAAFFALVGPKASSRRIPVATTLPL